LTIGLTLFFCFLCIPDFLKNYLLRDTYLFS
jgi:hypothetical protein